MIESVKIRCSSLTNYPDCARRVAADVFRDEIEGAGFKLRRLTKSIGAAIGTAVHKGAALMLKAKAEEREAPMPGLIDDTMEALHRSSAEGVLYDDVSPTRNDAEKSARRMLMVYGKEIAPKINPILVEERLEAEVTPTLILSGQSDVIAREPGKVRDLKTGKILANHRPQLGGYGLISRSNGYDIEGGVVDYIPRVSMSKPQPPSVTVEYDLAGAEMAAATIVRAMDGDLRRFREGDYSRRLLPGDPWALMANPNSRLCHPNGCAAWGTEFCKEHRKEN